MGGGGYDKHGRTHVVSRIPHTLQILCYIVVQTLIPVTRRYCRDVIQKLKKYSHKRCTDSGFMHVRLLHDKLKVCKAIFLSQGRIHS